MSNASRYIGVAGNVYGGTAKGQNAGGGANNNVGGTVFRPTGQSANQFPVSEATLTNKDSGGSAPAVQTSSNYPPIPQAQVAADAASQEERNAVAQTTDALTSPASAGQTVNFPKTTKTKDMGSTVNVGSNLEFQSPALPNAYVGITDGNSVINTNDLERIAELEREADNNTNKKIDGAAQGANSTDKYNGGVNGDQVRTDSITTLPGGVPESQEIGKE